MVDIFEVACLLLVTSLELLDEFFVALEPFCCFTGGCVRRGGF
jgi:hypothetical protein